MLLSALINWSRLQFAMSAMYHWIFVPLTLGLGVVMALAETKYYKAKDADEQKFWMETAKFWQKVFAINFATGIATGLILEFQFGTNWSNYSYFVGDIFGAPLAIEGMFAFFIEATFFAVMFFGWGKVSKRFHLTSTWMTIFGATISSLWILIANGWMQYPVGMEFNPDTVRNEMVDFWAVALSPVAIVKFFHSVISSWILGSIVVMGISAFYLLRKKRYRFAMESIKLGSILGFVATVITIFTGHFSANQVAAHQPMKLAAMENHYHGKEGASLSVIGLMNFNKTRAEWDNDEVKPYVFNIGIPKGLSFLSFNDFNSYVPGITDILKGGYVQPDGTIALSAEERMAKGRIAIQALSDYRAAKDRGDEMAAAEHQAILKENYEHFGYGYITDVKQLIPNVPILYYSFRLMVGLSMLFLLLFVVSWYGITKRKEQFLNARWLYWAMILCIPLVYICSQCGWIVAEMGRQPWTIQDILPVQAAVSDLVASSVRFTFFVFLVLFTAMLIAELSIMYHAIKQGPKTDDYVEPTKVENK